MNVRNLWQWAVLIVVACNGRLSVGDAGSAASGGADAGRGHEPGAAGKDSSGGNGAVESAGAAGDSSPDETGGRSDGPSPSGGVGGTGGYSGGYGAVGGLSGSGGEAPQPGGLGQPCKPGGVVMEAEGSPAKSQIRTLARCNEGLSCNSKGQCVSAPNCPKTGELCVVRRAALTEGSGGGGSGGQANQNTAGGFNSTEQTGVVALTANESKVYWVEYGTRDALGNYQHDGALLAYAIADGATTVVASGLEGPIGVELTTSHAYIYVDGARPVSTAVRSQLLRVPLAGGTAELVQEGARPLSFASAGSRAFWGDYSAEDSGIYSMTSDADASPSLFLAGGASWLATDATDLYYLADAGMMLSPVASAAPVAWGPSTRGPFVLHDDGLFGLESISAGTLLQRAPKSGGEFLRVRALGNGSPRGLQAVGDRFFFSVIRPSQWSSSGAAPLQVLTAGFASTDPPTRLLDRTFRTAADDRLWVGTVGALYWSEGRAIYKQPLPAP